MTDVTADHQAQPMRSATVSAPGFSRQDLEAEAALLRRFSLHHPRERVDLPPRQPSATSSRWRLLGIVSALAMIFVGFGSLGVKGDGGSLIFTGALIAIAAIAMAVLPSHHNEVEITGGKRLLFGVILGVACLVWSLFALGIAVLNSKIFSHPLDEVAVMISFPLALLGAYAAWIELRRSTGVEAVPEGTEFADVGQVWMGLHVVNDFVRGLDPLTDRVGQVAAASIMASATALALWMTSFEGWWSLWLCLAAIMGATIYAGLGHLPTMMVVIGETGIAVYRISQGGQRTRESLITMDSPFLLYADLTRFVPVYGKLLPKPKNSPWKMQWRDPQDKHRCVLRLSWLPFSGHAGQRDGWGPFVFFAMAWWSLAMQRRLSDVARGGPPVLLPHREPGYDRLAYTPDGWFIVEDDRATAVTAFVRADHEVHITCDDGKIREWPLSEIGNGVVLHSWLMERDEGGFMTG